jgi:hypothetical protein
MQVRDQLLGRRLECWDEPRCCRFGRLSHLLSVFSACKKKALGDPTWETKLLLQRAQNQTKGLSPDQVDEVSESAQAPDVPLVPAKAVVVDLSVDQDALLLVQRVAFQLLACDSGKSVFIVGVVLWWGRRARVAGTVGGRLLERQETHGAAWWSCDVR